MLLHFCLWVTYRKHCLTCRAIFLMANNNSLLNILMYFHCVYVSGAFCRVNSGKQWPSVRHHSLVLTKRTTSVSGTDGSTVWSDTSTYQPGPWWVLSSKTKQSLLQPSSRQPEVSHWQSARDAHTCSNINRLHRRQDTITDTLWALGHCKWLESPACWSH